MASKQPTWQIFIHNKIYSLAGINSMGGGNKPDQNDSIWLVVVFSGHAL